MLAKILGPSEHGAEYRSITYEWYGSMVTHDCAPIAQMSLPSPPRPVTSPSTANRSERRCPTGNKVQKKVQLKLDTFLRPPTPPPCVEHGQARREEHRGNNVVHYERGSPQPETWMAFLYDGWCSVPHAPIGVQKFATH